MTCPFSCCMHAPCSSSWAFSCTMRANTFSRQRFSRAWLFLENSGSRESDGCTWGQAGWGESGEEEGGKRSLWLLEEQRRKLHLAFSLACPGDRSQRAEVCVQGGELSAGSRSQEGTR